MEMGKEIRRLRNERGLTQEALAAALNVTAQTVSKWECGNSIPDVQLLPEIAVYFGVSIDQLFAMSPEQQMERIENHIYDRGMFTEAEERQLEQQLGVFAEDPALEGRAKLLLTKLYNKRPSRRPAATATLSASWPMPGAATCPTGTCAITTRSSTGSAITAAAIRTTAPP